MRHLVAHRKLGRTTAHRKSLLRNLCTSLILEERIETTLPKAKELRPFAEKAITLGKRSNTAEKPADVVHARRVASGFFHAGNRTSQYRRPDGGYHQARPERTAGVAAVDKLFDELAKRYEARPGGYTRIIKLGPRKGDGAEMAIIELVDRPERAAKAEGGAAESGKKVGLLDRIRGRRKKKDTADEPDVQE
ncbi:MAG TPA: 50S ribosomal protein L17 [Blastocatellia bacterium]|nr:50S ribosomal protein L17 [Blastocatellia bacterium]